MSLCNDPKCPLNRQGVTHEIHELIENRPVKNPCNDPRCAMNRMGMKHEIHDGKQVNVEEPIQEETPRQQVEDDEDIGSFEEVIQELGKRVYRDNPNKISREKILAERRKREQQKIEQEAQEVNRRQKIKEKTSTKSETVSQTRNKKEIPSVNQILHCNDPYVTFNLTQDTTCDEIKSVYRKLSKNYNASRGSANRSQDEQERLTKTQSKINIAYDFLRKKHCG